ncbi:MAG: HAMP domain-containing histidine kinase, partial [Bacteroidia bacterium]|nr:HAMP domain-containing histidine kinase [Bacteroidia bacterium]
MNIKTSLTFKFTAIVAGILLAFSLFTYQFSEIFREDEFTHRLKNVSQNVVVNYLDKEELSTDILKLLYEKQLNRFPQERLIIADENYEVIFASQKTKEIEIDLLKELYKTGTEFVLNLGDTEYVAYIIPHQYKNYFIVSSAIDVAGQAKLKYLRSVLLFLNIGCIFIAAISGWYFSKQALQPIKDVVSSVDTITERNLYQRVNIGNGKDEIAKLAIVFNKMLERIEQSFILQKMFVANASHEFRTPLTSMKGQIEVLLLHKRTEEEYKRTFNSLLEDIQSLISLINGLTELAKANADFPNTNLIPISIVDVIMDTKEELIKRNPNYKIQLKWGDFPEEEPLLEMIGDYSLLKSAFSNLLDNACKFSHDETCEIVVTFHKLSIEVNIIDHGMGIHKEELKHVFEAFYRSNESRHVPGYGIGLSLVKKTIDLHHGKINIQSE